MHPDWMPQYMPYLLLSFGKGVKVLEPQLRTVLRDGPRPGRILRGLIFNNFLTPMLSVKLVYDRRKSCPKGEIHVCRFLNSIWPKAIKPITQPGTPRARAV